MTHILPRSIVHSRVWIPAAAVATILVMSTAVRADSINLGAAADNTMYNEDGTQSNGAGNSFFAGRTDTGELRRALIRFDLGAIPAGATIHSVTLTLYCSRERSGAENIRLHRLAAAWGEGTSHAPGEEGSGAAATAGDATWTHRFFNTAAWTTPGGDYAAPASATTSVNNQNQYYTWSSPDMVADVQAWVGDPSGNHGWIILGNETTDKSSKRFESRQSATPNYRPVLAVNYTPPAPPTGACCNLDGSCQIRTQADCAAQGGAYQGDATACDPNPCQQPAGACCFADGACLLLSQAACTAQGGAYQGNGTACAPNPCPQPTGACCLASGVCLLATAADCTGQGGTYQGDNTACAADLCPVMLTPFVDALPIPAVAQPVTGVPGGTASYEIPIRQVQQRLHRDLPLTTVWGYGGTYPGPTIVASVGQPVTVAWINDLRDESGNYRTTHYLPVDTCVMGATDEARVIVHLHGGHVPQSCDGYPEDAFPPGASATYVYPNRQLPATLWYHDHALGITRLNVIMGLAGFYLLFDDFERSLDLPAGAYEIGLAIQDRTFNSDGSIRYPAMWEEDYFGDKILVNGKVWPYLNVARGKYRFRLLSGSTTRTYTLSLSNLAPIVQIGTEGGLLPAPVALSSITLGSGERADVVIDFAPYAPGTEILLLNSAPAPFPGPPGEGVIPNVMKFIVQDQAGHTAPLPAALRPVAPINAADAAVSRDLELRKVSDPCTGARWAINGLGWQDVTEFPLMGTTEIWRFINRSGMSHPMHLHLVMFQVLDRQDYEIIGGEVVPVGVPVPPPPGEAGWKDTVMCPPGQITRVACRFENYTGRYAYHCHILEHEEHEMMRQFEARCRKGDANQDTRVDAGDVAPFIEELVTGPHPGTAAFCASDVDGNGNLDAAVDVAMFVDCLLEVACP